MGGHNAGDYASRFTVETFAQLVKSYDYVDTVTILMEAVTEVNRLLLEKSSQLPELEGMGTTLVAATVEDNILKVANVGDSRLYLYGKDGAEQLTEDHNYFAKLNKMLAEGRITEETYRREAQRGHALTSFLGVNGLSLCCTGERQIERTDVVLLTSDGLYKAIRPESFCEIVRSGGGLESAADNMLGSVCKIKDRAIDNTTFILIGIGV